MEIIDQIDSSYVAVFDLDGTLLKKNSSFEFLKFLLFKKKITPLQFLYLGGCYGHHKLFSTSYQKLHSRVFNTFFRGWPLAYFQELIPEFLEKKLPALICQSVFDLLTLLQRKKIDLMILSNSPSFLVQEIARCFGVDKAYGTSFLLNAEGRLSEIDTIMDGEKKAQIVRACWGKRKIIAFSDGIFDLPFLQAADIPICTRPCRKLKKIAKTMKWRIL